MARADGAKHPRPASPGRRPQSPFPTRDQVLAFIRDAPGPVGKRDIARAFHISGADRIPLKALIRDLERDGLIDRPVGRKRMTSTGALPPVVVAEITGLDPDGDLLARPLSGHASPDGHSPDGHSPDRHDLDRHDLDKNRPAPEIRIVSTGRDGGLVSVGDRCLVRLTRTGDQSYEARVIKRLPAARDSLICRLEKDRAGGLRASPLDRKAKADFIIAPPNLSGAGRGDIVVIETVPGRRLGLREARVIEILGAGDQPGAIGRIALAAQGIPIAFPPDALAAAAAAGPVPAAGREDLRAIPLVTIDGEDARDFDDAVWAAADDRDDNPGGFVIMVAIADVADYVRPGDALDQEAARRGNSVYLPDQVVPMLPEALSNGWCSLKPLQDRGCLAVRIRLDRDGNKLEHRFLRGVMRSAARLTYNQVQAAVDGRPPDDMPPLPGGNAAAFLAPLMGAYGVLLKARDRRGTLDLDLPELRIVVGDDGRVTGIDRRDRHDSHRLIEEFMILANVCAAETLEARRWPCLYRVHDQPDALKVEALSDYVAALPDMHGLRLAKGGAVRPIQFTQLIRKARETPFADLLQDLVLRSQAQAVYDPQNIGHFGLGLSRYAHFTSPIRRYADLLVHRALIGALGLGAGALDKAAGAGFRAIGTHISMTERRAGAAERDASDRYAAAYMQDKVGAVFAARITGVGRFGLFARLRATGIDGLIPMSTLPDDRYVVDEARHLLEGQRRGAIFALGQAVEVRVLDADGLTGRLTLALEAAAEPPVIPEPTGGRRAGRSDKARPDKARPDKTRQPRRTGRRQRP